MEPYSNFFSEIYGVGARRAERILSDPANRSRLDLIEQAFKDYCNEKRAEFQEIHLDSLNYGEVVKEMLKSASVGLQYQDELDEMVWKLCFGTKKALRDIHKDFKHFLMWGPLVE